ncbi:MAG: methyltransferase [Bdellovibrionales bacterium]
METTCDGILGHRIQLEQPRKGFRVAVDTVFLAAAVQIEPGQTALDAGCGVGGAMLCLAARVPGIKIMGIEIQPELVELCRHNIERNGMQDRAQVVEGDINHMRNLIPLSLWGGVAASVIPAKAGIQSASGSERKNRCFNAYDQGQGSRPSCAADAAQLDPGFRRDDACPYHDILPASFDHVLMNPPYHEATTHDLSPDKCKLRANSEQEGELGRWLALAAAALKPGATLTMIHRADRLEGILERAKASSLGGGEILLVCPHENDPPSRVVLRLRKGDSLPPRQTRTIVLHDKDGRYTIEAEAILRHAEGA